MLYVFGLVVASVAWLLPGHYYPWTSFQQDVLAATGLALVALGAAVGESRWPARAPWISAAAVSLAVVPFLQYAAGLMPFHLDAVLSAAYLCGLAMAIIAGRQLAGHDERFVLALWGVIWFAGTVSLGIALVQWLQLGPMSFVESIGASERVSGNLRQPNQLASLFGLALAATLGAYEARRIGPWSTVLAMAAFGAGIVMTQSRAGWLFVAATVILWALMRRRAALRTSLSAVAVSVIAFISAVLVFDRLDRLLDGGNAIDSVETRLQPGYRLLHWETLWDALMRQPWTGYGWLQIPKAQTTATLDHAPTFEFITASHNQLLDLLLWNGLPLGVVVIGALAWWTVSRLRRCTDGRTFSLWLALAYLFAHSVVEFPLQYAYFLLPAGLIIGAIEAAQPGSRTEGPPLPRWVFLGTWSVMAALLVAIVLEYGKLEEAVRRVRMVEARYVVQDGGPFVPDIHILDWQREYVRLFLTEQRAGMSEQELQVAQAVVERYPSPGALMRLARANALNGRAAQAEQALRLLCHISKERHCDHSRTQWEELSRTEPAVAAVTHPPTPSR